MAQIVRDHDVDDILIYIPALRAYARALCKSAPDGDDLVQETLLRGIEKSHLYQPGTNMRAWLFTIMRNHFISHCRKAWRERTGPADCASSLPKVEPDQEWHLQVTELRAALEALPLHYREAIVLVGVLGESYIDAAEIMKCDVGTIKSRVNRARAMLRKALEPAL